MRYFRTEELARCFRENGARCRKCPLKQPAGKLPDGVERNLEALVEEVLDPARERLGGPVKVNSGYRCVMHNREVGGVPASQHLRGEAADICCGDNRRLAQIIVVNGRFDQIIVYPSFVHVSWKRGGGNRKMILRKTSGGYQKVAASEL
jgi:hypothetical protein